MPCSDPRQSRSRRCRFDDVEQRRGHQAARAEVGLRSPRGCWRCTSAGVPSAILLAEVQRDDLVRDAHHQAHVVLDQQHGQVAARSRMSRISAPSALDLLVVEAAGRLVEQQQLRLAGQCARQLDALLRCRTAVDATGALRPDRSREPTKCTSSPARSAARASSRRDRAAAAARWRGSRSPCGSGRPTITLSSTLIVREQREVLERAADAERGDAVTRTC